MANYSLPTLSSALYDVALECAARRQNRKCKKVFGSRHCFQCKHYVYSYTPDTTDTRAVNLLMYQAESTMCETKSDNRFGAAVFWIPLLGFIALCAYGHYDMNYGKRDLSVYDNFLKPKAAVTRTVDPGNDQHQNIVNTLWKVASDLDRKVDVNKDGKTNCIDAAVLFYQYYPDKSKVCIEGNKNPATGMNHLFNCEFTGGVWKAVEPQAYVGGVHPYWMWQEWGSQYDNTFNKDMTQAYIKYVKK